jgi:hypothetical protein
MATSINQRVLQWSNLDEKRDRSIDVTRLLRYAGVEGGAGETIEQLPQNLAAFDVTLTAEDVASLDTLSQPMLNFPAPILEASTTDPAAARSCHQIVPIDPHFCHASLV